ncbi:MAG: choice-of-anchor D domain-containing protein [Pseudomonadales bacterium]|jgi:hypothetical protein
MDFKTLSLPLSLSLSLSVSAVVQAQITEDFEDGNLDGWQLAGTVAINSFKSIDNYSMRLKGGAVAIREFPADGDVSLSMAAGSLENGNGCDVYVSTDGVNWGEPILSLSPAQDRDDFYSATTQTSGGSTFVRYVQVGSAADYCYADNISISGGGAPSPNAALDGNGAFGSVQVGDTAARTFTLSNTGNADLAVGAITGYSAPFSITDDTCSNTSVGADSSCNLSMSFTPVGAGSVNQTLSIATNDGEQTLALSGFGSDTTPPPPPSGDLHQFSGSGDVARSALTLSELQGSNLALNDYSAYSHGVTEANADQSNAREPSNNFEGRLVINGGQKVALNFDERTSGKAQAGLYSDPSSFPGFDFEFVQSGSHIIPKDRGLIITGHGDWNLIVEPGRVWDENNDNGFSRVAIPFSLQEVQANCTHNGIMSFAFKDDGSITNVAIQVGAETCLYFQYDLWGLAAADYQSQSVTGAATLISNYESEVASRIPTRPISDLDDVYSGVISANIGSEQASSPTTHGVLVDGVHYAASCSTRYGDYPFCEVMGLPSYSTAKTATAAFSHALLSQQFGDSARYMNIAEQVAECQDGINGTSSIWSDVTVENALDMTTGNYRLASYEGDEGSSNVLNNFFLVFTHDQKIKHACERYIRKATPNSHFSYHSSDTYIAGVAMDNYYASGDLFEKLVEDVYKPLNLSPATYTTVRTQGSPADPFWSHGMTWHADDMIKLGQVINDGGVINGQQVLDPAIMNDMLVNGGDLGLETYGSESRYLNSVWTYDMGQRASPLCSAGSWVSYMSGYGGIGVVMFPNGAIYYYVSDSNAFAFGSAETELNKIAPICGN